MPSLYDATKEDIANEVKAITKLCPADGHKNIVAVLKHGWLKRSPFYFIDMELCDFNLETYIHGSWSPDSDSKAKARDPLRDSWFIMMDIVSGLHFIHNNGHVHRDLKPRNGIVANGIC